MDDPQRPRHDDAQRGEASPEATSPFSDEEAEQADREGRHNTEDVEDNADLDG
jgi:hypothetical protein